MSIKGGNVLKRRRWTCLDQIIMKFLMGWAQRIIYIFFFNFGNIRNSYLVIHEYDVPN